MFRNRNSGESAGPNEMTFEDLKKVHPHILEAAALKYLQEHQTDYFNAHFNGQRDEDGFLIDKSGRPTKFKPSDHVNGDKNAMEEVVKKSKVALRDL